MIMYTLVLFRTPPLTIPTMVSLRRASIALVNVLLGLALDSLIPKLNLEGVSSSVLKLISFPQDVSTFSRNV